MRDEFHLRSVARVQVKGKTEPVDVFTLIGARNDNVDPELLKWLESYEEGITKFRERDFPKAKILFSPFSRILSRRFPGQDVSRTLARIRARTARRGLECSRGVQEEIATASCLLAAPCCHPEIAQTIEGPHTDSRNYAVENCVTQIVGGSLACARDDTPWRCVVAQFIRVARRLLSS